MAGREYGYLALYGSSPTSRMQNVPESSPLVYGFEIGGGGDTRRLTWPEIQCATAPERILRWIHLDRRSEGAREWVSASPDVDVITEEALFSDANRPRYVAGSNGDLLVVLRGVNCNPGADPEDMVALHMWFSKGLVLTVQKHRVFAMQDMADRLISGSGPTTAEQILTTICERLSVRIADVVGEIDDRVDELEGQRLSGEVEGVQLAVSTLRRQIIGLRRYLAPQREVLSRLVSEPVGWISDRSRSQLREAAERSARFVDDLESARDRASLTQEAINLSRSDQMNRTMYMLAMVATIFLPLSLVTGILGINVGGIPGMDDPAAFGFVMLGLVLLAALEYMFFRWKHWI